MAQPDLQVHLVQQVQEVLLVIKGLQVLVVLQAQEVLQDQLVHPVQQVLQVLKAKKAK